MLLKLLFKFDSASTGFLDKQTLDAFSGPCQTYVMKLLRGNINYFLAVNFFLQKAQI